MNPKLKEKLLESLMAVLPITLIVLALSVALVPMDVGTAVMFTVGAVLLVFRHGAVSARRGNGDDAAGRRHRRARWSG